MSSSSADSDAAVSPDYFSNRMRSIFNSCVEPQKKPPRSGEAFPRSAKIYFAVFFAPASDFLAVEAEHAESLLEALHSVLDLSPSLGVHPQLLHAKAELPAIINVIAAILNVFFMVTTPCGLV